MESGYNQKAWIALESYQGEEVSFTGENFVLMTSDASAFTQKRIKIKEDQKRGTSGETGSTPGPWELGSFSFAARLKASGSLGVRPIPWILIYALLGKETVNAGISVVYSQAEDREAPITFSVIIQDNLSTTVYRGCGIAKGTFSFKATEVVPIKADGKFLSHATAGTDSLLEAIDGTSTPVEVLKLTSAKAYKLYMSGARVNVGTDDNSGEGYKITAVDTAANAIQVTPGVPTSQEVNTAITPWTPLAVEAGYDIPAWFGMITDTDGTIAAKESEITITNPLKEDENKRDSLFPQGLIYDGKDEKSYSSSGIFKAQDGQLFKYDADNCITHDITVPAGDTVGKKVEFNMQAVELEDVKQSGNDAITTALSGKATETGLYKNALTILFK